MFLISFRSKENKILFKFRAKIVTVRKITIYSRRDACFMGVKNIKNNSISAKIGDKMYKRTYMQLKKIL